MEVTLYSKDDCPFCEKAKAHLEREGITYELNVLNDPVERNELYNNFGLVGRQRTMPQIFWGHERVGGYDDMMRDARFRDHKLIPITLTPRELRYILYKMGEPNMGFSDTRLQPGDYSGSEVLEFRTRLRIILDGRSS